MISRSQTRFASIVCACIALGALEGFAQAQNFRYEPKPRAGASTLNYASSDAAPRLLPGAPPADQLPPRSGRGYLYPRRGQMVDRVRYDQPTPARRPPELHEVEQIPSGSQVQPFSEDEGGDMAPRPPREGDTYYEDEYGQGLEGELPEVLVGSQIGGGAPVATPAAASAAPAAASPRAARVESFRRCCI